MNIIRVRHLVDVASSMNSSPPYSTLYLLPHSKKGSGRRQKRGVIPPESHPFYSYIERRWVTDIHHYVRLLSSNRGSSEPGVPSSFRVLLIYKLLLYLRLLCIPSPPSTTHLYHFDTVFFFFCHEVYHVVVDVDRLPPPAPDTHAYGRWCPSSSSSLIDDCYYYYFSHSSLGCLLDGLMCTWNSDCHDL